MHLHEMASLRGYRALAAVGLGLGLLHAAAAAVASGDAPRVSPHVPVPELSSALEVPTAPEPVAVSVATATVADLPPADRTVDFLFTADHATWVALAAVPAGDVLTHGKLRMVEDAGVYAALANVPARALPAAAQAWLGRELVVDGGACREQLEQFALVARLSGAPIYADDSGARWTPTSIFAHGELVLAARLVRCKGTYARPASSSPERRFERVTGAAEVAAAATARAVLLHTEYAGKAAADWKEMGEAHLWTDDARVDTIVARDPQTGITWVSAHAHTDGIGCGAPTTNFWGLFRIDADGALEQVALRELDEVASIDLLVDLDGDGTPELLGQSILGGPLALDATGTPLASLTVPYYGCPC